MITRIIKRRKIISFAEQNTLRAFKALYSSLLLFLNVRTALAAPIAATMKLKIFTAASTLLFCTVCAIITRKIAIIVRVIVVVRMILLRLKRSFFRLSLS